MRICWTLNSRNFSRIADSVVVYGIRAIMSVHLRSVVIFGSLLGLNDSFRALNLSFCFWVFRSRSFRCSSYAVKVWGSLEVFLEVSLEVPLEASLEEPSEESLDSNFLQMSIYSVTDEIHRVRLSIGA